MTSSLQAAKQGNPVAIEALINKNLKPKGVRASVKKDESCLRVKLEAESLPDQISMARFIRNGIEKLEPAGIDSLKIFGFQKGDDMPGWSQDVSLVAQPAQQPGLSDVKYTEPELVPTNRAISITLGILGLVGSLMFFIIPVIGWVIGALGVIGSLGFIGNGISGKGTLKGECPYCGADVSAMENMAGTDCTACKKRILIKDNKFWQTE